VLYLLSFDTAEERNAGAITRRKHRQERVPEYADFGNLGEILILDCFSESPKALVSLR